jgi:putative flippase GtrA
VWTKRALRYNCGALAGLVISVAVLAMLTHLVDMYYLEANLFAIGAGTVWNYAASYFVIWSMPTG